MRLPLTLLACALPAAASAADLSRQPAGPPLVLEAGPALARPARAVVVRTGYRPCVKCGAGLPWGGLRKTTAVELPWGGLPEACPPVRAIRSTVVVAKG